jgi:4-hydroxybenzoate polyprenyltransferase
MQRNPQVRALLSTARVANIPSVAVNVWLGVAMGLTLKSINGTFAGVPWGATCLLALAGSCLYVAGNFLNDWMDRDWDARHRPERALPCGLFKPASYLRTALLSASAGVTLAACVSFSATVVSITILACVVSYTVWHKRCARAVVLMGMCRAGLVWLGVLGVTGTPENPHALGTMVLLAGSCSMGILSYIIGLSLRARLESVASPLETNSLAAQGFFIFTAVMMIVPFIGMAGFRWMFFSGIVPYASWMVICAFTRLRGNHKHISFLLAGIPLVDWVFLLPLACSWVPWTAAISLASLSLPPLAFVAALLLQRLAPAT